MWGQKSMNPEDFGRRTTQEGGRRNDRVKSLALRSFVFAAAAVLRLWLTSFSPASTLSVLIISQSGFPYGDPGHAGV